MKKLLMLISVFTGILLFLFSCGNINNEVIIDGLVVENDELVSIGTFNNEKLVIPAEIKRVREGAFEGAIFIKEIEVPFEDFSLNYCVFKGCLNVTKLTIPVLNGPLYNLFGQDIDSLPKSLVEVCLTKDKEIERDEFSDCSSLEKVVIPNSVEDFDNYIFNNCKEIKNLTIPFIGRNEFSYSDISFLGEYIKESLVNLTITNASELVSRAFEQCDNLIIHYQGSQKYSSWNDYWHCGYPVVYNAEI